MGRFASTVPYYAACREPYPPAFLQAVAARLGLDGRQSLVDLGCGPGVLALGLAPFVARVVGVDPEPAMLQAAREAAAERGIALTLIEGRTETLPAELGPFEVATIGRALHWMEPQATRAALDRLLTADGAVLICGTTHPDDAPENAWLPAYGQYRRSFGDRGGRKADLHAFFAGTRFRPGEPIRVRFRNRLGLADLAGRTLSKSTSSPEVLGEEAGRLRERLAELLAPWLRDGELEEVVEAVATPCFSAPADQRAAAPTT